MYASIDIGTNTALLLIARTAKQSLEIIREEQRIPRLGQGVDRHGNLNKEAVDRLIQALLEYKAIIEKEYPEVQGTIVTATSAVRDAGNRRVFIERVKEETGFTVQILSGFEEAQYTFAGAQSVLPLNEQPVAVVDIGGGSTEIAYGKDKSLIDRYSYDMGCVRFTERYLHDNPPSEKQIEKCRATIDELLGENHFSFEDNTVLIGVAGTVTSLAHMILELDKYNYSRLNGVSVKANELKKWIGYVKSRKATELTKKYPEVMEGRADIFLAGLLILERVMATYDFEQLIVSTGGIRHGAILEMENK